MHGPPSSNENGRGFVIQLPRDNELRISMLDCLLEFRSEIEAMEKALGRGDLERGVVLLDDFADHVLGLHDKVNVCMRR